MFNVWDEVLKNPLLPYFFLDIINSKNNAFLEELGLNGKTEKVIKDLNEYINRYKTIKMYYFQDNTYITKDFLCSSNNIENVLFYFLHIVSQYAYIHPFVVLHKIAEYLNGVKEERQQTWHI